MHYRPDSYSEPVRTRRPGLGVALVVVGAGAFVLNAGASRIALRAGIDPALLTSTRVTGTVLLLLLTAAAVQRGALRPPRGRLLMLLLLQGAVGVAALQWTYFVAIDRLPVGMALLLEYQAPVLVALWARTIGGERLGPRLWWGLALALGGLAAATSAFGGGGVDAAGVAAGLGAAVSFAAYFLIGEAGVAEVDPLRVSLWSFGIAAVLLNLLAPVTALGRHRLDAHVSMLGRLHGSEVPLWLALAWVVVLGTVLPFFALLSALRFVSATTVTTVAMIEPVGVALLGWAWFAEPLGPLALGGCAAVVAGILLAESARAAHPVSEPPVIT